MGADPALVASQSLSRPSGFDPGELPSAICGYPLPGWRLDHVQWDEREGQPDGWIVSLKREKPDWRKARRAHVVMARSDVGPLEAWDEALRIVCREEARIAEREAEMARIEARSDATPKSDAAEGESRNSSKANRENGNG